LILINDMRQSIGLGLSFHKVVAANDNDNDNDNDNNNNDTVVNEYINML